MFDHLVGAERIMERKQHTTFQILVSELLCRRAAVLLAANFSGLNHKGCLALSDAFGWAS
jgi:hypothetical protein